MRAKLISRKEDHTYVIEMDHELAHHLFLHVKTDPGSSLQIANDILHAQRNAIQIGNLRSLWNFINGTL